MPPFPSDDRHPDADVAPGRPILSLILCSRNDNYAGNPVWRLQTALNYMALRAEQLKIESSMEVIVCDWGSHTPLRKVLSLSPVAARLTRFLEVPPALAVTLQQDSPFPEVLANNAAIRRARGTYIGRIDQDTLVSREFLQYVSRRLAVPSPDASCESEVMFVGRYSIPLEVAQRCPPFEEIVRYMERFGRILPPESKGRIPWYDTPTGIFLMHRRLWWQAHGYNEQMLYWGFMEAEVIQRLADTYPVVDLGRRFKFGFHHLSHTTLRIQITQRRKNPRRVAEVSEPRGDWGLAAEDLVLRHAEPNAGYARASGENHRGRFAGLAELASWLKEWLLQAMLMAPRLAYNAVRHLRSTR